MLTATVAVLGVAAAMQLIVYTLLIVNRTRLLNPVLAGAATALSALASLAAVAVVAGYAVQLTRWLIARRAAVFARRRLPDPRSARALRAGCLVPVLNVAWAPVYVIELAAQEGQFARLRKPIVVWWLLWAVATAASVFATATSWAGDAQGIADNTVAMAVAYLLGLAATVAAGRVVDGFERRPVAKPAHRWVMVAADRQQAAKPAAVLEPDRCEPAA